MPQRAPQHPLLTSFQRAATTAVAALQKEIAQREQELVMLKAEAARWQTVLREPASRGGVAITPARDPPRAAGSIGG